MAGLRGGLEEHGFWFPFFSSLCPCSSSFLHPWVFLPCWKLNISIEQKSWSIDFQSVVLKYILDYIKDPMTPVWVGVSLLCHQNFINMIKLSWDIANFANISSLIHNQILLRRGWIWSFCFSSLSSWGTSLSTCSSPSGSTQVPWSSRRQWRWEGLVISISRCWHMQNPF